MLPIVAAACTTPMDPDRIALRRGFQPETIVSGPSGLGYVSTLTGGGIEEIDLRTHAARFVVQPGAIGERVIAGIAYDPGRHQLVACGAWLSQAYVFDAQTGALLSQIEFPSGLINAVALRGADVYFTESVHPVFYRATRDVDGRFTGPPVSVPLTGAFHSVSGLTDLNSNGIVAVPGRSELLIVHSARGELYRVDPSSGDAQLVDVGGADLLGGDGLLLDEQGLVVVQNGEEGRVSLFHLAADLTSAARTATLTDPRFRSPTSAARDGASLWVVDSRLLEIFHGVANPDDAFDLVRVTLPGAAL